MADTKKKQKKKQPTVDRALVSGVPENQILHIKRTEISDKVKTEISRNGKQPHLLLKIIETAITVLELLIRQIFTKKKKSNEDKGWNSEKNIENIEIPKCPVKTPLASAYFRLSDIYEKLKEQNYAIYEKEQQLQDLQFKLNNAKGIFKGKQRKELQSDIENMKKHLSRIVKEYGYDTVKAFMTSYQASKEAYDDYQLEFELWKRAYGNSEQSTVLEKLQDYPQHKINHEAR